MHTGDVLVAAVQQRDVHGPEAFVAPLLRRLLVEVLGFRGEDNVVVLGHVQHIEEVFGLAIEPWRIERRFLLRHDCEFFVRDCDAVGQ